MTTNTISAYQARQTAAEHLTDLNQQVRRAGLSSRTILRTWSADDHTIEIVLLVRTPDFEVNAYHWHRQQGVVTPYDPAATIAALTNPEVHARHQLLSSDGQMQLPIED